MRCATVLLLSLTVTFAWANDRGGRQLTGTSQLLVRGESYYYAGGLFYRPTKGGYMRVDAPVGARVPFVPKIKGTFTMGGERYFVAHDGTFFWYDPRGGDYTVVNEPYGWRDYFRVSPEYRAVPVPRPVQYEEIPRAYPRPYARYRGNYGGYWGYGYYGRYGFRDDIYDESYRERKSTCRRIARDQSRRDKVGPYRRQPGNYWDEYERCMR
ncbi:DUF6515 family protein [Microbulbifer thermotolerans]|uniref:Uncharacterized protein n=1 Tax=Microbulbifer thermotolerans TaxID=252514 RepID=A0A143HIH1_MICTH|nr:DUF6515 family protein [Microbulbifer thermotolerans]AMX01473.1 hypothetical protein A3224_01755 [Microbulbifer thermotolerans]MCX2778316.1 hypothetical protein [Microbulbifer thermotolerans]MCX2783281.1 hypothetical protein [Microbulbifer thermotolerans]MCX2796122.1 hypothetical protein [Microbulbifer thermotolerans]MCX2800363.1 hypothetical protein [Microbulbifer thermotolerans]